MTGYTVHTGSNEKFTSGWDRIFDDPKPTKKKKAKKSATKKPATAAKKKAAKKKAKK